MSELDPNATLTPAEPVDPEVVADQPAEQELSKKARKKLAKTAYFESIKMERRAREKEVKKEKKRVLAQKRAAGELDSEEEEQLRAKKKPKASKPDFYGKVVVDLGFDDKMNDKVRSAECVHVYFMFRKAQQSL